MPDIRRVYYYPPHKPLPDIRPAKRPRRCDEPPRKSEPGDLISDAPWKPPLPTSTARTPGADNKKRHRWATRRPQIASQGCRLCFCRHRNSRTPGASLWPRGSRAYAHSTLTRSVCRCTWSGQGFRVPGLTRRQRPPSSYENTIKPSSFRPISRKNCFKHFDPGGPALQPTQPFQSNPCPTVPDVTLPSPPLSHLSQLSYNSRCPLPCAREHDNSTSDSG